MKGGWSWLISTNERQVSAMGRLGKCTEINEY